MSSLCDALMPLLLNCPPFFWPKPLLTGEHLTILTPSDLTSSRMNSCTPPSLSDIEQPLTGRNLIKPTDLFPKQTQDFDLHLLQPFNQVVPLALDGHTDTMNPFEQLEDPTQGRPRRRLVDLV